MNIVQPALQLGFTFILIAVSYHSARPWMNRRPVSAQTRFLRGASPPPIASFAGNIDIPHRPTSPTPNAVLVLADGLVSGGVCHMARFMAGGRKPHVESRAGSLIVGRETAK